MLKRFISISALALASILVMTSVSFSAVSGITKSFTEALDKNDYAKMSAIIKENKDKIPAEIQAIVDEAMRPETQKDERASELYVAEYMAKVYNNTTGDYEPLKHVKQKIFESMLSPAVRPVAVNGVYIIVTPKAASEKENVFSPNNIIIKKGSTVRWVNKDVKAHIFASMPFIGEGGIFSPRIKPGESWEYKFEKPGDYYYICFIHKSMIGKIKVEN